MEETYKLGDCEARIHDNGNITIIDHSMEQAVRIAFPSPSELRKLAFEIEERQRKQLEEDETEI